MAKTTATIDPQGRIAIPKKLLDKKGLEDEVEIVETEQGLLIRSPKVKSGSWSAVLSKKLIIDPQKVCGPLSDESYDDLWL